MHCCLQQQYCCIIDYKPASLTAKDLLESMYLDLNHIFTYMHDGAQKGCMLLHLHSTEAACYNLIGIADCEWSSAHARMPDRAGVVQAVLEMYEEVACQVAPVQAGVNGIRVVPPAASPTPDMLRGPQQQPTPTAQQQAIQKSNAMLAAAQQRQAAVVGSGSQSDPQLAQHLRPQSRAVAPANMFMPASSTKVQRGIDQKPARHAAERESRPDSLSSGHASAAGVKGAHPAVAAAARSPALGNSHQTGQTYAAELIETDIL